ncbi:type V CRISPR-associated protein Cas12a/Cpf1 [Patescibacteria group bacterium]|nr:type V CRISPR-associated protein Cas12a/Cpf1 [Patescibacteria group bacterium]
MEVKNTSFEQFTDQYSLSKTLRFELRPVGETPKMLEENNVFGKDKNIQKKYEQTKPFFDRLHRDFVKDALTNVQLDGLREYFEIWKMWQADSKNKDKKKKLENKEKQLRKNIVGLFDDTAKKWLEKYSNVQIKKKDRDFLFEENIFSLLQELYGKEEDAFLKDEKGEYIVVEKDEKKEKISLFEDWKGFVGYFGKFFETRKNFYKDDGTASAIATRIVDQNLRRFCNNLLESDKANKKVDFLEVESTFNIEMKDIFSIEYYSNCLSQEGIDAYNRILGADSKTQGMEGINQYINKYRQKNKGEQVNFLKGLDKQILSEKMKFIDEIESDEGLEIILNELKENVDKKVKMFKKLFFDFVDHNDSYDLSKIYFSKESLNTILYRWFSEPQLIQEKLFEVLNKKDVKAWYEARKISSKDSSLKKDDDGTFSFPSFVQLAHIREALENIGKDVRVWKENYYKEDDNKKQKAILTQGELIWDEFLAVFKIEFQTLFEQVIEKEGKKEIIAYDVYFEQFEHLLNNFQNNDTAKEIIKLFLDSALSIYQMAKYFAVEKKRNWIEKYEIDDNFYDHIEYGYKKFYDGSYDEFILPYNKVRNYLTKKPYSEEKWKLNFENSTLADGWDKNKESDNSAVLLKKDSQYFLALMKKGNNKIFDDKNNQYFIKDIEKGKYEKVTYKLLPGANKMLPKVFFSKKSIDFFAPSERVLDIRNHSSHSKNGNPQKGFEKKDFNLQDCYEIIDFFKDSLSKHEEWNQFDFIFSDTGKYKDISDFYREVSAQGYKISFQDISEKYIQEKNEAGELYLFQIKNKDWNEGSKGKKNLQTLYFESLFSQENMQNNFSMKLNGQAEIFYRPKTDDKKLGKKLDKSGKEIVNHKRYSENKILFHVPITINRTSGDTNQYRFNQEVNNFLAQNKDINIIGIDRGEKHLAYYSVIDQNGKIIYQDTLNIVNGIDYAQKLEEVAKGREQARKDWKTVEGIKNLKQGYISQVVHEITDLAIKHNAIIVLEDLNMRFKQIRGGIEKSVYQQLEKALIDKLSFLVKKGEKDPEKAGNLLRAYQLAAPFESFQKMGKQTGIIFYTQASYTSKTCPNCGFRPNLRFKYNSIDKSKELLKKLDNFFIFSRKKCFCNRLFCFSILE